MNSLLKVLEAAVQSNRPLLIVAEDVDSDALAMLILNKHHVGFKICPIKAPGFGDNRKTSLDDLAVLTGAELGLDAQHVAGRILRLWEVRTEVRNANDRDDFVGISMVMLDAKNSAIHCFIPAYLCGGDLDILRVSEIASRKY